MDVFRERTVVFDEAGDLDQGRRQVPGIGLYSFWEIVIGF